MAETRHWVTGAPGLGRSRRRPQGSREWFSIEIPVEGDERQATLFREDRAVAATLLFIELGQKPLPLSRLMRLLYQLDRTAIADHRTPVTFDDYERSRSGPQLVSTRRMIGGVNAPNASSSAREFLAVSKSGAREPVVGARDAESPRALSKADLRLAGETFERFAGMSSAEYADYLRENCPEAGLASFGMPDIMTSLGMSSELATNIASMEFVRRHAA